MNKATTASRLRLLMNQMHLRQIDILNAALPIANRYGLKLNKSDISQYVSGKVEPSQDKLVVLSEALHVTPAWLLGYDVPMKSIGDNIYALRTKANLSDSELADILHISLNQYRGYEIGHIIPPLSIIARLSEIFKVDKFEIIGWNEFDLETPETKIGPADESAELTDSKEDVLIFNYRSLDDEKKNSLIDYSNYLKNQM